MSRLPRSPNCRSWIRPMRMCSRHSTRGSRATRWNRPAWTRQRSSRRARNELPDILPVSDITRGRPMRTSGSNRCAFPPLAQKRIEKLPVIFPKIRQSLRGRKRAVTEPECRARFALMSTDPSFPEIRESVRRLCARFPGPYWQALDRERKYPTEFVTALTKEGFLAVLIPEEFGGSGLGLGAGIAVLEEIHR